MALSDEIILICAAYAINYFIIYRKLNRFIANMFFIAISVGVLTLGSDMRLWGMILVFISIIMTFYDAITGPKRALKGVS